MGNIAYGLFREVTLYASGLLWIVSRHRIWLRLFGVDC